MIKQTPYFTLFHRWVVWLAFDRKGFWITTKLDRRYYMRVAKTFVEFDKIKVHGFIFYWFGLKVASLR